jgi:hypothetical protein
MIFLNSHSPSSTPSHSSSSSFIFLILFMHCPFPSFFFSSFSLLSSHSLSLSCEDMRTRIHPCPRLYNSSPRPLYLFFLSFAFGWSCGIFLATSISTCKGRRNHKHFEGDPLAFFAKQKFKGCIYLLDACVFSYIGVYVKIFKRRRRRNRRPFLGICRCHGFFGGWCGQFELH